MAIFLVNLSQLLPLVAPPPPLFLEANIWDKCRESCACLFLCTIGDLAHNCMAKQLQHNFSVNGILAQSYSKHFPQGCV